MAELHFASLSSGFFLLFFSLFFFLSEGNRNELQCKLPSCLLRGPAKI